MRQVRCSRCGNETIRSRIKKHSENLIVGKGLPVILNARWPLVEIRWKRVLFGSTCQQTVSLSLSLSLSLSHSLCTSYRSIERISVAFRVSEMWLFRVDVMSTDSIDAIIFHISAFIIFFLFSGNTCSFFGANIYGNERGKISSIVLRECI